MSWGALAELLLAGLLVVTLVYLVRVQRGLQAMRGARAEFESLFVRFTESTAEAERSMSALHLAADRSGKVLQEGTQRADALRQDLLFLAERASLVADRLEGSIQRARKSDSDTAPRDPAASQEVTAPNPGRRAQDRRAAPDRTALVKALGSIR